MRASRVSRAPCLRVCVAALRPLSCAACGIGPFLGAERAGRHTHTRPHCGHDGSRRAQRPVCCERVEMTTTGGAGERVTQGQPLVGIV